MCASIRDPLVKANRNVCIIHLVHIQYGIMIDINNKDIISCLSALIGLRLYDDADADGFSSSVWFVCIFVGSLQNCANCIGVCYSKQLSVLSK